MKNLVLGSVALIVIGMSIPAFAADMPVKAPPPSVPTAPYNWSGLYVGGNFGGAWTSGNLNIPGNNFYSGLTKFIAGVQAGYNFQAGHFLFGVEGDFDWATFDHPTLPFPTLGSVSQHWIGTAAARVGVVDDQWLVYGKVGGGWVHSTAEVNAFGQTWNGSSTKDRWLVGGGLEYGLKPHWTVRLEYDFLSLANWTSATVPAVSLNRDVSGQKGDIAFVPLAMPLMCGPGAIATMLGMTSLVKHSEYEILSFLAIAIAILATMFVTYLCLAYARNVIERVGPLGIDAITRIVRFFVATMGGGLIFHGG